MLTQLHIDAENLVASRRDDFCQFDEIESDASSMSSGTVYTQIRCSYHDELSGETFDCESSNFTSRIFDKCNIDVKYTYSVINKNSTSVRLLHLIDESFVNIINQSQVIEPNTEVSFIVGNEINICGDLYITKQVVAILELDHDDENSTDDSHIMAHNSLLFKSP